MRVLHIITSLHQAGAQTVLYRLIGACPPHVHHVVISLTDMSHYGPRLEVLGAKVHALHMPRGRVSVQGLIGLRRLMAEAKADVVQTWMYHADLIGGLVGRLTGAGPIVWGIRNSNLLPGTSSLATRITAKVSAWLSPWLPAAIVCCSSEAAKIHRALGYDARKMIVVPNGYDLRRFFPSTSARARVRRELGADQSDIIVGMVARWDAQKDHRTLLSALSRVRDRGHRFRCVLVGPGLDAGNSTLVDLVERHALRNHVILAGSRDDIPDVMNALDLHILSSAFGEAFPNVVAEAMACGTPCIATDVGDSGLIVGETGWIVQPSNSAALAAAIEDALQAISSKGRDAFASQCHSRIRQQFGIDRMVDSFLSVWSRQPSHAARRP